MNINADDPVVEIHLIKPFDLLNISELKLTAEIVLVNENWQFRVSIIFVDDEEIVRINRSYLKSNKITDVIAFSADDEENRGEVYINYDQVVIQAEDSNESVQKAASRLLIHGILHVGGWEDYTETAKTKMLAYGEQYLKGSLE